MCEHKNVICINPYETIRKYKCLDCSAVMMCSCDEKLARKYFAHQINTACILETQERIPVTDGFQKNICPECRHENPISAPRSESYRNTSKIKRYYWRELYLRSLEIYDQRYNPKNLNEIDNTKMEEIKKEVLEEIKKEHSVRPKYEFIEGSQEDLLNSNYIKIRQEQVKYHNHTDKKALVESNGELLSVEEYGAKYYEKLGYSAIQAESRPFHVLFGIYMWEVIQDPNDPILRQVGFGSRTAYDNKVKNDFIWMMLPRDFGTNGYYERRKKDIEKHIENLHDIKLLFEDWLSQSMNLREYLWAHRKDDIEKARKIITVIDLVSLKRILRYLIQNYWGNYCGWPDLFIYKGSEFGFVEVKGSGDKLREDQKRWILDNKNFLNFNFELLKLTK